MTSGADARALFANSIISGNVATNSGDEFNRFYGGGFVSSGYNLLGDSSSSNAAAFVGFIPDLGGTDIIATTDGTLPTALTSILNTTLSDNGGPTKTHALVVDSPAIDAGLACSETDQRGILRSDGKCDIGSVEFSKAPLIFTDSFE